MNKALVGYVSLELKSNPDDIPSDLAFSLDPALNAEVKKHKSVERIADWFCDENMFEATFELYNLSVLDVLINAIIELISNHRIPSDHSVTLRKKITENGELSKYRMMISPNPDSDWVPTNVIRKLGRRKRPKRLFPERIAHLEAIVAQYKPAMIGGLDPLFPQDSVLKEFFNSLMKKQRSELAELRQDILEHELHEWILDWATGVSIDEEDPEKEIKDDCLQFLAFLDRLSETNLVQPPFELMDWGKIAKWEEV